jgi:hypothetical protein
VRDIERRLNDSLDSPRPPRPGLPEYRLIDPLDPDAAPPPMTDDAEEYTDAELAEAPWGMANEWPGDAR